MPLQRLLSQANISLSNKEIKNYMQDICEICIQSKYDRKINKSSTSAAEYGIGERIHSDIGGPISPKTYNGYRYYITFLDKASRYLHISLLRSKDEAIKKFTLYKQLVENQLNKKIKEIFTDNGKEYVNDNFHILLGRYGIIHRTTPIYTKELNSLIERINLTLINKVRCLLIQSGLKEDM
jgi:hypothetical protein